MVSKTRVSISKTMSIVSSVQKVGVSISLRLSLTLAITIIPKTMSIAVATISIVSSIAKVSQSISTISTIEKVGISISLGLGLRLSKGNSGQKGNSNSLHHLLASPRSDQQRNPH